MKSRRSKIPAAVSDYMAGLARKAAASMKGTPAAAKRAKKAAAARWKDHARPRTVKKRRAG